ncbi:MAG: hypothetical protein JEY79_07245 [Pseudodesulfovibrio sp.]|nr:hypothetical protein [Pseudodesulfovibrio sp.]
MSSGSVKKDKLTEYNTITRTIERNAMTTINVNCPFCSYSTLLHCALTRDNEVAIVSEGLCACASERVDTVGGPEGVHTITLTFCETASYASIHKPGDGT